MIHSDLPRRAIVLAAAFFCTVASAGDLPVPCFSCNGRPFVSSGAASYTAVGTVGTIQQQTDRVILNWQSFNIGAGNKVVFDQPSADSAALNRIFQNDPSRIFGALQANGQVYLINQNGIVFGAGAQVDTRALTASTLDMSDRVFNQLGVEEAMRQGLPAFEHDASAGAMGSINIEQGAVLQTAEGGRILVLAPEVVNRGTISTPGGETVLAASEDKVYLTTGYVASGDLAQRTSRNITDVRGILVEVDTGGSVTNLGQIIAERGNIGLVGLAVNQSGTVRATTSVNQGGSIWLVARDRAVPTTGKARTATTEIDKVAPIATRTGTLTLGENSVTEIGFDPSSPTAVDAQPQPQSQVELMGRDITLEAGARVSAAGGNVQVTATVAPGTPAVPNLPANDTSFVMKNGSRIDVSGATAAVLPMARNTVAVELRGSQLADSPLQRDGPLRNKIVTVDVRKGTPFANIAANEALVERPVAERLAAGGAVSIWSEGSATISQGATVDFSGGAVTYESGVLGTTKLIRYDGQVVDISDADPNVRYLGMFGDATIKHGKWGVTETFGLNGGQVEAGYVEGKDAGSLQLQARTLDISGTLRGEVIADVYQRNPAQEAASALLRPYDQIPLRGQLMLGDSRGVALDFGLGDFMLDERFASRLAGVGRLDIYSNGRVIVPAGEQLALPGGGALNVTANQIEVAGRIDAPSGTINMNARQTLGTSAGESLVHMGSGASIVTAGEWVNDYSVVAAGDTPSSPVFINGGSVTLRSAGDLLLDGGSSIDTSGGAQWTSGRALRAGTGGAISLAVNYVDPKRLALDGELRSDAVNKGGALSLTAPAFIIGDGASTLENAVRLDSGFFEDRGFSSYAFNATHGGIEVTAGTDLQLTARNLVLDTSKFQTEPTGAALVDFTAAMQLPDYQRSAVSMSLLNRRLPNVLPSQSGILVDAGARIATEPKGTLLVESDARVVIDGTLEAPAGTITVRQTAPTNDSNEQGYDPTQAIWLGAESKLLARAALRERPSVLENMRMGDLFAGGTVTLDASRSYVFTAPGSVIDVSGRSEMLAPTTGDRPQMVEVNADAGSIVVRASEGALLGGTLHAAPGEGAGARGGALSLQFDFAHRATALNSEGDAPFPDAVREIRITEAPVESVGSAVPLALNGLMQVAPSIIAAGGFDAVELRVEATSNLAENARVNFADARTTLAVDREIAITTPVLMSAGAVELAASHVMLGSFVQNSAAPTEGPGSLSVQANLIDLVGNLSLQDFGGARFSSSGDVRFTGRQSGSNPASRDGGLERITGRLRSMADVNFAADQIYPTTLSDYTVSVERPSGAITVAASDGSDALPLSAGGFLELAADRVDIAGVVRAPLGQIRIDAQSANLLAGSLVSTSGDGLVVPFGTTQFDGADWIYDFESKGQQIMAAPDKRVELQADRITLAPGAVVDVTGGGDLQALEFVPGPGGTRDILGADADAGAFAIVPTLGSSFASYDPSLLSTLKGQGRTVVLDGASGLPAGEYAILPAAYALLPGAFLVTPRPDAPAMSRPASVLPDGSQYVTGRYGYAGTQERDSLATTFHVETSAQVLGRAQYRQTKADGYFAARDTAAPLNRDAGNLVLSANSALDLGGVLAKNAASGRGSQVDIIASRLSVVSAPTGALDAVELVAADLNALGADSLSLGAIRRRTSTGTTLDVRASDVQVQSGSEVSQSELLLAATQDVTVHGGARIAAQGAERSGDDTLLMNGDAALLRISAGDQVEVARVGGAGAAGTVTIEEGASVDAARSMTIDVSANARLDGAMSTHGGSLRIGAPQLSLGASQGAVSGLLLSGAQLDAFDAQELVLSSRGPINIYGALETRLDRVIFDSAGLIGHDNDGQQVSVAADSITLRNSGHRSMGAASGNGTGTLQLSARTVNLRDGDFVVQGFGNVDVTAAEQFVAGAEGIDTALKVAGNLTITTSRVRVGAGVDAVLGAVDAGGQTIGSVNLMAPSAVIDASTSAELGGRLDVIGTGISVGTRLDLPSGDVRLHATGPSGIALTDSAVIDVAGRNLQFADVVRGSVGGHMGLQADAGPVTVASGARLDASGATAGADAGRIEIDSAGALDISPTASLVASANEGNRTGSVLVAAQSLTNGFSSLNAQLTGGGIFEQRSLHLGTGDLVLAAGEEIRAHRVELATGGSIDIFGRIDARGVDGGSVALSANGNLTLASGATIDARARGREEAGGEVRLATQAGTVSIEPGATIDVAGVSAGGAASDTGTVLVRAPRIGDTAVGMLPVGGLIRGAERIEIEAFRSYTATTLDASSYATVAADTATYMANAATIKAGLGLDADPRVHFVAGEEIATDGDLTVTGSIDFLTYRPGNEAGVLTLRAGGNLNVLGSLSDGVALASSYPDLLLPRETVQTGDSWSYRLVAGADLASADAGAVKVGTGDLTLGSGAKVRTGTGRIDVAAGRDFRFADGTAALYTMGVNRGAGEVPTGGFEIDPVVIKDAIYNGDFLQDGGSISVRAGRNIQGADGNQFISDWMARANGIQTGSLPDISVANSWAVNVAEFRQNLGTLGGGNIRIEAGGDIDTLGAMLPTTGQPVGPPGSAPSIAGGGDLHVYAGGDLRSGMFYVERGRAQIDVGGRVTRSQTSPAYPVLAAGATQIALQARKSVSLEAIVNPFVLSQSFSQGTAGIIQPTPVYFFSYSPDSSARVAASSGDVLVRANSTALGALSSNKLEPNITLGYGILPATFEAYALQGSLEFGDSLTLFPAARGNLELIAAKNIGLSDEGVRTVDLTMSDADPTLLPGLLNPTAELETARAILPRGGVGNAKVPVHTGDTRPALIVARDGVLGIDPEAEGVTGGDRFSVYLSKQARLHGASISNLNLTVQHVDPNDVTVVASDSDIDFPTQRNSDATVRTNGNAITIDGPGRLDVIAAGNVNLAASEGIISRGRRFNSALPEGGAAISVLAGVDPDLDDLGFIDKYLARDEYAERLQAYLERRGVSVGSSSAALDAFRALPREQRRPLVLEVLYNEILQAGIAATDGGSDEFQRGYDATEALFGADRSRGDLNMFLSRITTIDGGDVNIAVPHGLVNAGVANTSILNDSAKLARLGIVVEGAGDVNALVDQSFLVNQTRVFALDGGNVLIWAAKKDIDAGGGAKTALTVQKPDALYNFDALPTSLLPPAIAGSGIRTAVTTPGRDPGSVYLFAPAGIVNAGDAGIQSVGNITIVAVQVTGADNISAGGTAVGVPTDTGGLGASVAGVSATSGSASSAAAAAADTGAQRKEPAPLADAAMSWLDVFVVGFGEEGCKPDDMECMKRNQKN